MKCNFKSIFLNKYAKYTVFFFITIKYLSKFGRFFLLIFSNYTSYRWRNRDFEPLVTNLSPVTCFGAHVKRWVVAYYIIVIKTRRRPYGLQTLHGLADNPYLSPLPLWTSKPLSIVKETRVH